MNVNVLGTKFNFRNYSDDEEAVVSLLEGKVLVNNNLQKGEQARIEPDHKVFLNKKNGDMHVSRVNAHHTVEWTNGYLFFDEELLSDIVKKLERSYDVRITISDPTLGNLRFYGNFVRKEQTIEKILKMLESTGKIKYCVQGKDIQLHPV
jgi:ferric-dicitrate binding protein FerR (iron transport regulator)